MSKWIKVQNFENIIMFCENPYFLVRFEKHLPSRLYKILCLRHGLNCKKMSFNEIVRYIKPLDKNKNLLSARHIAKLYYQSLDRIKKIIEND